mgnify:CR=1 FL=1
MQVKYEGVAVPDSGPSAVPELDSAVARCVNDAGCLCCPPPPHTTLWLTSVVHPYSYENSRQRAFHVRGFEVALVLVGGWSP